MPARSHHDMRSIEHVGFEWIYSDTKKAIEPRFSVYINNKDLGCKCQGCGNQYKLDLIVPNDLWEKIKPEGKPKGAGLLCGSCIMKRLSKLFKYAAFELKEAGN